MLKYLIPALVCVHLSSSLCEHERCVDNTNAAGICKKLMHCESVTEEFKLNGIQPKICSKLSDGTVIVCCRDGTSIPLLAADINSRPTRAGMDDKLLENYKEGAWKNDKDSGYYSCNTNADGDTSCIVVDASFTSGKKPDDKPKKVTKIGAPPGFMPDNGTGSYYVYSVYNGSVQDYYNSFDDREKEGGLWGMFFQEEVVIFKYKYKDRNGQDAHVMYYWIGTDASQQDKKLAQKVAGRKADKLEGETTIVKVLQGAETPHFLKMFNNNLIVLRIGEYDQELDGVRLFRVQGSKKDEDLRVTTLLKKRESLEDDGVFVLDTFGPIYVWRGKDSIPMELDAALDFVKQFSRTEPAIVRVDEDQEPDIVTVEQGQEPQAFWDALLSSQASEETSSTAAVPSSAAAVPSNEAAVPPSGAAVPLIAATVPSNEAAVPPSAAVVPSNAEAVSSSAEADASSAAEVPSSAAAVPLSAAAVPSSGAAVPSSSAAVYIGRPSHDAVDIPTALVTRAPSSGVAHGSWNSGFTLSEAIVRLKGTVRFENIPDFRQEDLAQDGAYILDTGEELYLWLGASLPERIKNARNIIVEAYRKRDANVERTEAVFTIPQGREPALFKRIFPAWDPNLFKNAILSLQAGIYGV